MKLKPSRTAAENARLLLPKLFKEYCKAGRKAVEQKRTPKQLHGFRVATKQFRYSLELFRPVYGPKVDRQLSTLRDLQSVLGKLSDYHSIRTMVAGDKPLEAKLDRATKKALKEFHKQWAAWSKPPACSKQAEGLRK